MYARFPHFRLHVWSTLVAIHLVLLDVTTRGLLRSLSADGYVSSRFQLGVTKYYGKHSVNPTKRVYGDMKVLQDVISVA